MPELPEVETIRAQLVPRLVGRTLVNIDVVDPSAVAPWSVDEFVHAAVGQCVSDVTRRGKYLVIECVSGDRLVGHLRMTGRLHWRAQLPSDGDERFLRILLLFDDGSSVTFGDARRFGRFAMVGRDQDMALYWRGRLGPEPLGTSFTPTYLAGAFRNRRVAVKSAVLNQALIAGVGNMYADEALYGARIHPERAAGSLTEDEIRRLCRAIRRTLALAISHGGASIDSYRDGLGQRGQMQDFLKVHLHEGEVCRRCATIIVKSVVGQRGTYWCPGCQPDPSGAAPPVPVRRPRRIRQEVHP
jgi:formamidopyrimidine-DNA glycosylase